jgi:tetratricopeptide (TPR) repeat protein
MARLPGGRVALGQAARRARASIAERAPARDTTLALAALLAAFVVVGAIALGELAHRPTVYRWASRPPAPLQARAQSVGKPSSTPASTAAASPAPPVSTVTRSAAPPAASQSPPSQQPSSPRASQTPPPTPQAGPQAESPAVAAELQARGHQLLAAGSYASAVPALAAALRASGQSLAQCVEPASEACLTFAYALYDLGRALRLEGRHGEAVSVLSQRLRIDNQRPVVQRELELARAPRA